MERLKKKRKIIPTPSKEKANDTKKFQTLFKTIPPEILSEILSYSTLVELKLKFELVNKKFHQASRNITNGNFFGNFGANHEFTTSKKLDKTKTLNILSTNKSITTLKITEDYLIKNESNNYEQEIIDLLNTTLDENKISRLKELEIANPKGLEFYLKKFKQIPNLKNLKTLNVNCTNFSDKEILKFLEGQIKNGKCINLERLEGDSSDINFSKKLLKNIEFSNLKNVSLDQDKHKGWYHPYYIRFIEVQNMIAFLKKTPKLEDLICVVKLGIINDENDEEEEFLEVDLQYREDIVELKNKLINFYLETNKKEKLNYKKKLFEFVKNNASEYGNSQEKGETTEDNIDFLFEDEEIPKLEVVQPNNKENDKFDLNLPNIEFKEDVPSNFYPLKEQRIENKQELFELVKNNPPFSDIDVPYVEQPTEYNINFLFEDEEIPELEVVQPNNKENDKFDLNLPNIEFKEDVPSNFDPSKKQGIEIFQENLDNEKQTDETSNPTNLSFVEQLQNQQTPNQNDKDDFMDIG